jgi:hypothetical protein
MKICPTCDNEWPEDANFCPKDGTNLMGVPSVARRTAKKRAPAPVENESTEEYKEPGTTTREQQLLEQARLEGFSETQWFMVAKDPDQLKHEPTTDELLDMQEDYGWDESISEDERSKFSLRRKKK